MGISWKEQHCGLRRATYDQVLNHMPDLSEIIDAFPEDPKDFFWDVKVHMLMPGQFPCIPGWHQDNVPRDKNGKKDYDLIDESKPIYIWVSGDPLTEFIDEQGGIYKISKQTWFKFSQKDRHRGVVSDEFTWRGFIRATHKDLEAKVPDKNHNPLRRHSQVYLDSEEFNW